MNKTLRNNIFSMIIPISVEGLLQMIASTIVMGMIGRLDLFSINAWGLASRLTQTLWALIRGLSLGITLYIAADLGAGNTKSIRRTVVSAIGALFTIGLLFSGLIALFAPQLIALLGGEGEVAARAVVATRICCLGMPFWTLMMCTSGILQGHGDAKTPMILTTVYNFACAGIGYLLIFGALNLPRLEIRGAAMTMVISQILMSVVCVVVLARKGFFKDVSSAGLTIRTVFESVMRILRLGVPPAVENVLWQLGAIAMLRPILHYGDYAFAAHQLGMQAEAISYMPTMGFAITTSSFISRSFGSGDMQLAEAYYRKILKYITIVTTALIAIIVLARAPLMSLLTNNENIISLGGVYLITVAVTLMPSNLNGVKTGAIRGAGYNRTPMIITFIGLWVVRVPLCYISAYLIPNTSIVWIWSAMGADLVVRYTLSSIYLKKNRVFNPARLFLRESP